MTNYEQQLRSHYGRADLGTTILDGLRAAGKNPDRLSLDDLAPVDQFHIGGRSTTLDLMRQAGLPIHGSPKPICPNGMGLLKQALIWVCLEIRRCLPWAIVQ